MIVQTVDVVVDIAARNVDKPFTYVVPESLRQSSYIGRRVKVEFGKRTVYGFIIDDASKTVENVKAILSFDSDQQYFDRLTLDLAVWTAQYYMCPLIDVIHCLLPPGLGSSSTKVKAKLQTLIALAHAPTYYQEILSILERRSPAQARVINHLLKNQLEALPWRDLAKLASVGLDAVKALEKKGLVKIKQQRVFRDPYQLQYTNTSSPLSFNKAQQIAFDQVAATITNKNHNGGDVFLLHGVTGSGKTEIYLQAVAKALVQEQSSIVLVPEIALAGQMVERFKTRFADKVTVLHSRLSEGERLDAWRRIQQGVKTVIIGARSAIFAPVRNLGLIIIDEEHEFTYKQEDNPKYHTREVAQKRADLCGASVILGSATPSIESYHLALTGKYTLLEMTSRIACRPMPKVTLVDMRTELAEGNRSVFSRCLQQNIAQSLSTNGQIVLFLNRRGYSTFVLCRECGFVMRCHQCSVSLTYHRQDNSLRCHYCHLSIKTPDICPKCNSRYIRYFGTGTQKVEEEITSLFPQAKVLRMDQDTTSKKFAHETMLAAFRKGEYNILLGTQMISKGLDFPNITLVGVITADTSLNLPDFRAGEKTFQLLAQVSGRAGRGDRLGQVVIQTYNPEHYAIQAAEHHDYQLFYEQEINQRKALNYPPFSHLIKLTIYGAEEQESAKQAHHIANMLNSEQNFDFPIEVLGPVPAPLQQIKGDFRWQIFLKGTSLEAMRQRIQPICHIMKGFSIDVEPVNML